MEYRILGPITVDRGGEPIDVGSPRQRALLTLLLLNRNRVVSTTRILEELWPHDPLGKERTLWVYISRLRSVLEPDRAPNAKSSVLITRDHGYSLEVDDTNVDAARFEDITTRGSGLIRDDPDAAAALLTAGLDLWRGAALEEVAFEDFAQSEAHRLEELRLKATEDRIDADLHLGRHRDVAGELSQLVTEHPTRERLVGLQMLALYRSGRQADALRAFERHRVHLHDQLGLDPSPELRRLEEQVLLHDRELASQQPADDDRADDVTNPFMGLRPFADSDSDHFFGRDRLIAQMIRRVENGSRLLALVGASGSGKSSALAAGFVPAIARGVIEGSEHWPIARMVPGTDPFLELEAALRRATDLDLRGISEQLADPTHGIVRACLRILPDQRSRAVIVIDQFEELFNLGASPNTQMRFVRNLEAAIDDAHGRILLAIGLRADFYGAPLEYPTFAEQLGDGIINVVPLTLDELESAAERPAEQAGVSLEPALVVQLLSDVAGESGGLPLFQYALTDLFERRQGRTLTLADYEAMGGVSGALGQRAEELFLELNPTEQQTIRQVFLRMVAVSDQRAWSRRRLTATELLELDLDVVALQAALARLGDHRLVTFDRDPVGGAPTVEVAHEALLSEWPRLRTWIREGEDDVLQHQRLAAAHTEWRAAGEHDDYLLTGERLAAYERWATETVVQPSAEEHRFLGRSLEHRRRQEALRAEHDRETARLSRRTRHLWLVAAAALIAVAATAVVIWLPSDRPPEIAIIQGPAAGDPGVASMIVNARSSAERAHGIEIDLAPTLVDPEDHLRTVAESGADLIIVPKDFDFQVELVAPDFPDVHFVALDPVVLHIESPNITEVHFDVEHGAFLAGVAAAWRTNTGRVGFIGGLQSFRTERARNGFEQGVDFENSTIEITSAYLGPVTTPLTSAESADHRAHELASEMYSNGVDVIFHDAGAAGAGVIQAAADRAADDEPVWAIGSNVDQFLTVPSEQQPVVLTSTIKRFDTAVTEVIDRFLSGELAPGELRLGIEDAGVELSSSGNGLAPVAGHISNVEAEISALHLNVSPHAVVGPAWQDAPDVTVGLSLADDGCEVTGVSGARVSDEGVVVADRDARLLVELSNDGADIGGIALREIPPGTPIAQLRSEALEGIPESFDSTLAITRAQLGGTTSSAAVLTSRPIAVNCFNTRQDFVVLIVRPT